MAEREFFEQASRARVKRAVETVEGQTSAELVVAVRKSSAAYRHVDLTMGLIFAFVVLLVLLFHPQPFSVVGMPFELLVAFALGAFASASAWSLKRALVSKTELRETTHRAACATFVRLRIARCSGRNGILVFVSMLERRCALVADLGVDEKALGPAWSDARGELDRAVTRADFAAFVAALEALGPILGTVMPRAEDDVNELPDEPDVQ